MINLKKQPFKGLFTQGMVCHETYKDQQGKWLSPEEVTSKDGKKFYKKDNISEKVLLDRLNLCQNQKKILLTLKI